MNINVIVAMSHSNRGIGFKNNIPWHIPDDLKRFSKLTKGDGNNAIIMGRKTWESLPLRPLPKRQNIILSKQLLDNNYEIKLFDNELYFSNLNDAIENCKLKDINTVWIIGGEKIYDLALKTLPINRVYITTIIKNYECDTFFPKLSNNFKIISTEFSSIYCTLIKYEIYENTYHPFIVNEKNNNEINKVKDIF